MQHRPTILARSRPWQRRALVVALLGVLVLAPACGSDATRTEAPGADETALPTLPPVEERDPELFDDRGCLVVEPGSADCSTRAEEIDAALAGEATGERRTLAGFSGRFYTDAPAAGAVVVLEETVSVATAGAWSAQGLVRNEREVALEGLVLHASLRAADGTELATATTPIAVSPLRPGEPAPFQLASDVPAPQVASVGWSVSQDRASARRGGRDVEVLTYWERGASDPRAVDMYLHRDEPPAHPYLLFGGVTNVGPDELASPTVVAAWLDGAGRVVWVAETPVVPPDRAGTDATQAPGSTSTTATGDPAVLAAGSAGDFLLSVDAPGAPLDGLDVVLWAVSG